MNAVEKLISMVLLVRETEPGFSVENVPLNEEKVFRSFVKNTDHFRNCRSRPRFRSQVTKHFRQLDPASYSDLFALVHFYQGEDLEGLGRYIRNKSGSAVLPSLHPVCREVLRETHGFVLHREQLFQIITRVGGLTQEEADDMRRALGKKKTSEMNESRTRFVSGAVEKGTDLATAESLFDFLAQSISFSFTTQEGATRHLTIDWLLEHLRVHYPEAFRRIARKPRSRRAGSR